MDAVLELKHYSTERLLDLWEMTTTNSDHNIPAVRGWLMDEIERRFLDRIDTLADLVVQIVAEGFIEPAVYHALITALHGVGLPLRDSQPKILCDSQRFFVLCLRDVLANHIGLLHFHRSLSGNFSRKLSNCQVSVLSL